MEPFFGFFIDEQVGLNKHISKEQKYKTADKSEFAIIRFDGHIYWSSQGFFEIRWSSAKMTDNRFIYLN